MEVISIVKPIKNRDMTGTNTSSKITFRLNSEPSVTTVTLEGQEMAESVRTRSVRCPECGKLIIYFDLYGWDDLLALNVHRGSPDCAAFRRIYVRYPQNVNYY